MYFIQTKYKKTRKLWLVYFLGFRSDSTTSMPGPDLLFLILCCYVHSSLWWLTIIRKLIFATHLHYFPSPIYRAGVFSHYGWWFPFSAVSDYKAIKYVLYFLFRFFSTILFCPKLKCALCSCCLFMVHWNFDKKAIKCA